MYMWQCSKSLEKSKEEISYVYEISKHFFVAFATLINKGLISYTLVHNLINPSNESYVSFFILIKHYRNLILSNKEKYKYINKNRRKVIILLGINLIWFYFYIIYGMVTMWEFLFRLE